MCRSLRLCRTAMRSSCSSRALRRRGTSPCSAKKESGRALESLLRSFAVTRSHALLLTIFFLTIVPLSIGAILRGANEHFHEVIVKSVVKLSLKAPFKLRIVEVAGMKIKIVGVNGHAFVFEPDDDFNPFAFGARGEVQQRMLIETELRKYAMEARVGSFRHAVIVREGSIGQPMQASTRGKLIRIAMLQSGSASPL